MTWVYRGVLGACGPDDTLQDNRLEVLTVTAWEKEMASTKDKMLSFKL